ncbi:MAG: thioredoxin domain-containing protein [Polyangiaceae bacterium]
MSKCLPLSVLLVATLATVAMGDVHAKAPVRAVGGPIPITAEDASWGSPSAPVTLVTFTDLQCPFCGRLHGTIEQLKKDYGPAKLRVVTKHFPLAFHKQARPAAEAADAVWRLHGAKGHDKFVDDAFTTLRGPRAGTVSDVLRSIGVPEASVKRLLAKAAKKVDADIALGKELGVRGTPASFVNGVFVSGAQPKAKLADEIDGQLAEAKALRRQGVTAARISETLTKKNFVPHDQRAGSRPTKTDKPNDDKTEWREPVGKSPVLGPDDALVTLVVFSEFQCPFCERVRPTLMTLKKRYGNQLRFVFKHHPLPFHKRAKAAANFALEALAQGGDAKFWAAHDKLFSNHQALEDFDLERYARELNMNVSATMVAVRNEKHAAVIEDDVDLADDVEVRGTPHSFINGRRLSGSQPITKFEAMIDEEIGNAKQLVRAGVPASKLYAHIIKTGKTADPPDKKTIPGPSAHTPTRGGARAKVTLTMFTDFQCPFCGRAVDTIKQVEKTYGKRVRIAFRHKPLPFHRQAMGAHEAAAEAFRQGGSDKFWSMYELLFADQKSLDRQTLEAHARSLGLNMSQFRRALDSGQHKKAIEKDIEISEDVDIRGTPAFVINGHVVTGAQPFAKFRKVIDRALKDAK